MRTLGRYARGKLRLRAKTQARGWMLAGFAALAMGTAAGAALLYSQSQGTPAAASANPTPGGMPRAAGKEPPANPPAVTPANSEPGQNDPGRQIAQQTANLLQMATDLKTEVYKTRKDTLSVAVVRKAGEIEKLAHTLRDK